MGSGVHSAHLRKGSAQISEAVKCARSSYALRVVSCSHQGSNLLTCFRRSAIWPLPEANRPVYRAAARARSRGSRAAGSRGTAGVSGAGFQTMALRRRSRISPGRPSSPCAVGWPVTCWRRVAAGRPRRWSGMAPAGRPLCEDAWRRFAAFGTVPPTAGEPAGRRAHAPAIPPPRRAARRRRISACQLEELHGNHPCSG